MSKKRDLQTSESEEKETLQNQKKVRMLHFLDQLVDKLSPAEVARAKEFVAPENDATVFQVVKKTADMSEEKAVLAMLCAKKDQPYSWPKFIGCSTAYDQTLSLYFDIEDAMPIATKTVNEKSFVFVGYSKFFSQNTNNTQSRNTMCEKNIFVEFPYPRPRNFASTMVTIRQYATIVREYLQREEFMNEKGFLVGFFSRSLLLDPFAIYRNEFGRVFHIPMVDNTNFCVSFVPPFILGIGDAREKFRVASLFCLIRLCYVNVFGRSFDTDFAAEIANATTYKQFCDVLTAERFPAVDYQFKPASVLMIDWMMKCLKNTIHTAELDFHTVFVANYAHTWTNNTSIKEVQMKTKYATLTNLVQGSVRITDEVFVVSVKTNPTEVQSDCLSMKRQCVETLATDVKRNVDFSLSVYAAVIRMLRVNRDYPRGMLLSFVYSDAQAVGVGVSREIVFRAFEGVKYWTGFEFDEELDTLDYRDYDGTSSLVDSISKLEFIVVLLYWIVTNNETLPFMLSPSLLSLVFNLSARNSLEHMLDYTRIVSPSFVNKVLNTDDTDSDLFYNTYSARSKLKFLEDFSTSKPSNLRWTQITRFEVSCPVLRNFQTLVRSIYSEPNELAFALSLRTYDGNHGRKWEITPELAIALSNFTNFSLDEDADVNDDFINDTLPLVESTFKETELKLLYFLFYCADNDPTSIRSFRIDRAARRQTYCFYIRWMLEANTEQLSNLWKNLHGYTKIVPFRFDQSKTKLPENVNEIVRAATTPTEKRNPYKNMTSLWRERKTLCDAMKNKHLRTQQVINVEFRSPHNEAKYQLAPQFMTCTKTVVLSICHDSYESFATTMNRSCSDNKVGFTTDL